MADLKERIVIDAVDNTTRGFRSAQNKLNAFDRTARRLQTTLLGFVGVNIFGNLVAGLARASDNAIELEAKLRLMTDGTEDYNIAQKELVKISLETGTSLSANTILFTRMNRAVQALGGTTDTTLKITKVMAQGLRISGASAQESASVIRQYSQAMSSGVLRGEEFNAIMENGGRIAVALAKGLGVPIGALREMAKQGLLTAKTVNDALLSQADTINNEASQLPITMGRALENINTNWTLFLQNNKEANNVIAEGIQFVAENFEVIKDIIINGGLIGAFVLMAKHLKVVRLEQVQLLIQTQKQIVQEKALATQQKVSASSQIKINKQKIIDADIIYTKKLQSKLIDAEIAILKSKSAVIDKLSAIDRKKEQFDKLISKEKEKKAILELNILDASRDINSSKIAIKEARYSKQSSKDLLARTTHTKLLLNAEFTRLTQQQLSQKVNIANSRLQVGTIDNLIRLQLQENELLITEEKLNQTRNKLLITTNKQNQSISQSIRSSEKLVVAKSKLVVAETKLSVAQTKVAGITAKLSQVSASNTKAVYAESTAVEANTIALSGNTISLNSNVIAQNKFLVGLKRIATATGVITVATKLHTGAVKLNAVGLVANNVVMKLATGVVGRLSVAVGFLSKVAGRLSSVIFGLPGLIALITYEIADFLGFDFGLGFKALSKGFTDITIKFKDFFGILSDGEAKKALDENNKQFSDWSDKRIADAQAVKAGFKDSAEQIDKLTQNQMALETKASTELKRQLDERSKSRTEALSALNTNLDVELEAVKFNLSKQVEAEQETKLEIIRVGNEFTQKRIEQNELNNADVIESEEQLQAKLFAVEKEFAKKKFDAKTASLEAELADINSFYAKRIEDLNTNEAELLANNKVAYGQSSAELKAKLDSDIKAENDASKQRLDDTEGWFNERETVDYEGLNNLHKLNNDYETNLSKLSKSSQNGRKITTENHKAKLLQIEKENAEAVKKVAESMVVHLRTQLTKMRFEYNDYSNKSKNVLQGLQEFERSVFGDKRTEYKKTSDALKEVGVIDAKLRKADLLDQQGKTEEATKLRETTLEKLKELTQAQKTRADNAKKGSKAQVDADGIAKTSMALLVTETGKLKKGYDDMTASLATRIEASEIAVKAYIKVVDEADLKLNKVKNIQIKTNAEQANKELQSIVNKLAEIKDKTVRVDVIKSEITEKANGGLIKADKYADGGFIPRKGKVQGSGDQDTVKALLTPGEFVIKKSSVAKYGYNFLNALNQGQANSPQKYAEGGSVQKNDNNFRADQVYTKYFNMLEKFQNVVSSTNGKTGQGRQNQSAYYGQYLLKQFVPSLSKLGSMPDNAINKVDSLIKKLITNVTRGATGGLVFKGNVSSGRDTLNLLEMLLESDFKWFVKPKWTTDKKSGGLKRFAEGGQAKSEKAGVGDSIKALLTPGEFVVRNSSVQKFGSDFFNSINQGIMPQKFAKGGLVGDSTSGEVITVNFNIDGNQATGTFPNDYSTSTLLDSLKQAGAVS